MTKVSILLEVEQSNDSAFEMHAAAVASETEALRQSEQALSDLAEFGIEITGDVEPVPMFSTKTEAHLEFGAFASADTNPDAASDTMVVACEVPSSKLEALRARPGTKVWPNSRLTLLDDPQATALGPDDDAVIDLADSRGGIDCRPFRPAVEIEVLRTLLGARRVWEDGYRGQNVVVGIIDEGVNGDTYPVLGGFAKQGAQQPGQAPISSHGSMCAADILVAAPAAKLYDYPFLGIPNSGGALRMFQAVLDQRRIDGTPHLTNNSYGFVGVPPQASFPNHEVHDIDHPLHRKIREVVASGAAAFFAAGNCGAQCPSAACHSSGIGPGQSIHASNALLEVITVAAANSRHERIGYSSQGPGMFEPQKPDVASFSHFFGNSGPGRPAGGGVNSFDNGTSAATPVAAGVGALLLSAMPGLTPDQIKTSLIQGAINIGAPGWDAGLGHGVVNAAASYDILRRQGAGV
ncbi:MAG: S8 family serine peptidase [Pseudomonadota bacterium]